uniref:DOP1-like TPR domain-containing protein n=1 Tax=Ciona savignyi TaxID=51511 RepID=H2Z8L7_CIOSA
MLPEMTSPITLQLCRNLKEAAAMYGMRGVAEMMPPDYVVSSLKSLRTLCHFTLLLHVNTAAIKHNVFSTSGQVLKVDRAAQLTAANTAVSLNQASNVGLSALSSLFNVFSVSSSI